MTEMMANLAFWILSVVALFSGWRVFRTDSMVRASFLLMASFISVGLILLLLAAPYLGMATIFMMAVEMMVMALFMVMFMMNPAGLNPMMMVHQHRFSMAAGVTLTASLILVVMVSDFPDQPVDPRANVIAALGRELLGDSMLVFESVGVTLLAAMIGAVILSSSSGRYGQSTEGSVPPGLEPDGEPAGRVPNEEDQGDHCH